MSKEIAKPQLAITLISKGVAYIDADVTVVDEHGKTLRGVEAVTHICDTQEWIQVSGSRSIRTHQVVEIMSPREVEDQRRYQRGWYIKGEHWYNGKNEKCERIITPEEKELISKRIRAVQLKNKIEEGKASDKEKEEHTELVSWLRINIK